ncbi:alpha/beta fold hydrolase [Phormidesmis sp. 146-12]
MTFNPKSIYSRLPSLNGSFCSVTTQTPAPTLVIWGRQDPMVPVSHAQNAAKIIPNTQLELFEQCGHWSPIEYPQKFNQLVLEFLS